MQRSQPITMRLQDKRPESVMSPDQRKFRTVYKFGRKKRNYKRKRAECAGGSWNSLHDPVQSRNSPAEAAANRESNADSDGGRSNASPPATPTVTDSGAGAAEVCTSTSRKKLDLFGGMYLL